MQVNLVDQLNETWAGINRLIAFFLAQVIVSDIRLQVVLRF